MDFAVRNSKSSSSFYTIELVTAMLMLSKVGGVVDQRTIVLQKKVAKENLEHVMDANATIAEVEALAEALLDLELVKMVVVEALLAKPAQETTTKTFVARNSKFITSVSHSMITN